jgi:hypothetical protein
MSPRKLLKIENKIEPAFIRSLLAVAAVTIGTQDRERLLSQRLGWFARPRDTRNEQQARKSQRQQQRA